MTSLSEAYGGRGRSGVDPRRLYLGVGSFVAGALLLVAGILAAAEVAVPAGYSSAAARELGGILGGVGVPLVLLGVMAVLPADRSTYAAAVVGAAVMCLGVALFTYAYPERWVGGPRPDLPNLTLHTAGVYFLGAATALWSVFVGVANFKIRNDPGGTVTMEVTHKGETRVVEVPRDQLGSRGGVGLLGGTPDGDVETQTNRPDADGDAGSAAPRDAAPRDAASGGAAGGTSGSADARSGSGAAAGSGSASGSGASRAGDRSNGAGRAGGSVPSGPGSAGVSDGGSAESDITSPLDDAGDGPSSPATPESAPSPGSPAARDGPGDAYCGNCEKFDYVRTDDGMRPYCAHYDELMDDMEACDAWTPR
jgi:hypothetical protein